MTFTATNVQTCMVGQVLYLRVVSMKCSSWNARPTICSQFAM